MGQTGWMVDSAEWILVPTFLTPSPSNRLYLVTELMRDTPHPIPISKQAGAHQSCSAFLTTVQGRGQKKKPLRKQTA